MRNLEATQYLWFLGKDYVAFMYLYIRASDNSPQTDVW